MTARLAVVGAGWWAQGWHLPHLQANPRATIAAIVDCATDPSSPLAPDLQSLSVLGERFGAPVFSSVEELLAEGPALDGAVVSTPHHTHFAVGRAVLEGGLHCLLEKPMTTNVTEAKELAALASASSGELLINHTANFRSAARKAHRAVCEQRRIGDVEFVTAFLGSPLLWIFDSPDAALKDWNRPGPGMLGNGFGWGQASHILAWIFQCTGLTPVAVHCAMRASPRSGGDVHNAATIHCSNGAIVALTGTAAVPGCEHAEHRSGKLVDFKVFGSEGALFFGGDDNLRQSGRLELRRRDHEESQILHPDFCFENYDKGGTGPESLETLIKICLGQPHHVPVYNAADAHVGLKTVLTLDAMYRSAQSGTEEAVRG